MRALQFLRNRPIILLGIVVAAFAGWVVSDSTNAKRDSRSRQQDSEAAVINMQAPMPVPEDRPSKPMVVTAAHVPQLKPGMTRTEVESIIGLPPSDMVSPVSEVDGRMTYTAAYLANLDPGPAPIRGPMPVGKRLPAPPNSTPKSMIAIEFDASKPGHPLLNVNINFSKF